MSSTRFQDQVTRFFSQWGGASLKLPTGWFGRPRDNSHELSSVGGDEEALVIELDGGLVLTVYGPQEITSDGHVLRIAGFQRAHWRWLDYASGAPHDEEFDHGTIEFVAGG